MHKRLGELSEIHYGKAPKDVLSEEGTVPVVGTGGIYGFANTSLFSGNAIVVPRKGSLDKPSYQEHPFWAVDTTYAVLPRKNVDGKWLYYQLDLYDLRKLNEATGVPSISRDWLSRIQIPWAEFPEQNQIAKILSTIDAEIEQTEVLIAKWQKIKAGMMQDLFTRGVTPDGHLRPTYADAPHLYKESPLGWIPKEWEYYPIEAIGNVVTGNTPPEECFEADGNGVAFITPGDVGASSQIKTTERSLKNLSSNFTRPVPAGTICVVCIGSTIGKIGLAEIESVTNQQINSVVCFKKELSSFYRYTMEHFLLPQLRREAGLQAVPIVKKSSFQKLLLAQPQEQFERVKIMNILDAMCRALDMEINVRNKLAKQKSGLMHDLLTGRVPVSVPDDEKDAA